MPGETRCSGAEVQTCGPSGAWSAAVACPGGTVCDSGGPDGGDGSTCVSGCFIGGGLYAPNAASPAQACQTCQPAQATLAWTTSADGAVCSAGECCAGACTDLESDVNNCSTCGHVCMDEPSSACVNGACRGVCVPGATQCSGALLQTCDTTGSWSAATSCPVGEMCNPNGTAAVCAPGCFIGGYFIPAQNVDGTICGTCDPASSTTAWTDAPEGTACETGTCCGAECTNMATDPANCGSCGRACTAGPSPACTSGACTYTLESALNDPYGIAVDSTNVYWTNFAGGGPGATLMMAPLAGGASTLLASGQFFVAVAVAVDATNVSRDDGGDPGTVMKVPIGGGTITTLASGQYYPLAVAVNATNVVWTNSDGTVMTVPIAGETTPTTLASGQDSDVSGSPSTRRTPIGPTRSPARS